MFTRPSLISVSISVFIHLIFIGAVIALPSSKSALPIGANLKGDPTIVEFGRSETTAVRKKKPAPLLSNSSNDVIVKKVPEPESASVSSETTSARTQFGSAIGTTESGQLGVANGSEVSERERYIYELRRLIDGRKFYPAVAKRMRQTGTVVVQFEIHKDGKIDKVSVVGPSSHERLNIAASNLIAGLRAFKPLPDSTRTDILPVTVPIAYGLY